MDWRWQIVFILDMGRGVILLHITVIFVSGPAVAEIPEKMVMATFTRGLKTVIRM